MAKKFHGGLKQGGNRANMPQDVKITDYPEYPCGGKEGYNDTMSGIDEKIRGDNKGNNKKGPGRW